MDPWYVWTRGNVFSNENYKAFETFIVLNLHRSRFKEKKFPLRNLENAKNRASTIFSEDMTF